ncbi:hypothetical protein BS78_K257900 [Paspalum vaginatum]|uniref:Dirigent protein n=1 Tax=Paspalum vaginatum TaxID=158149 RepID=A0A9W7XA59_9POAL|nr:hypothetical protein BS78_K257900 [Paspalum vaginatum]
MAGTNPSYYQSGACRDIRQKEHHFHLYLSEHLESSPHGNQKVIVNPNLPNLFGLTAANDWNVRDGPAISANIVARARGMLLGTGKSDENWLYCFSIIFNDARFKGSSIKMLGDFSVGANGVGKDGEWAIVGGTGDFAYAQGVVTAKLLENMGPTYHHMWELHIRVFCLCIFPEVKMMGPWGGNGGEAFDIPKPPRSLQTVTIQWGDVINSVAFSYTNQAGQKKNAGPWGGDNGAVTVMIKLAPSEVIKQVLGTTGKVGEDTVVASLTLVSNIRTYGPFGKANGTPFSSQVPDGKSVAGFYARAGASVNALGVYYA